MKWATRTGIKIYSLKILLRAKEQLLAWPQRMSMPRKIKAWKMSGASVVYKGSGALGRPFKSDLIAGVSDL